MVPGRKNTARGLAEEAKNRMMLLLVCAFGLAYLMSMTSSSVWVNLPAAMLLIIFLRYLSRDLDIRKSSAASRKTLFTQPSQKITTELKKEHNDKSDWRRKVKSPAVEEAIDQFTRHLISEWVTDLWYSRITPDKDGPEELVQIVNDALGEISSRARDVNLIDLLTRDVINLFCNHLELYRTAQSKIGKKELEKLPANLRDNHLRLVLAGENKLHPALFSVEAEHKVLQHLMAGLVSLTFKGDDLHCFFFRNTARELLACAVVRPLLNLANPRIINEKVESLVLSFTNKTANGVTSFAQGLTPGKPNEPSTSTAHQLASFQDHSVVGVELMQLKQDTFNQNPVKPSKSNGNEIGLHISGGKWGNKLDAISMRKTQTLAPDHLENMWARGRNYKKRENVHVQSAQPMQKATAGVHNTLLDVKKKSPAQDTAVTANILQPHVGTSAFAAPHDQVRESFSAYPKALSNQEKKAPEGDVDTESSYSSEGDDSNNVTGLDSPGTRVWESKNKTIFSRIHHPLENSEVKLMKKSGKPHFVSRTSRTSSGRRRHRASNYKLPIWHEDERSSYLLGDGIDVLTSSKGDLRKGELSDSEVKKQARPYKGVSTSSLRSSVSKPEIYSLSTQSSESLLMDDSFLKLRCEVTCANNVKSGSVTFTVYSIAVTDSDNNSWSIKRRFRHFEELHRLLKDFSEYNLSLPPKQFLFLGLDAAVIQERCILLDKYLKDLLQLPSVSRSIEVWDFLSVDSQTYTFSDSLSIIQTLSGATIQSTFSAIDDLFWSKGKDRGGYSKQEYGPINNVNSDILNFKKSDKDQNIAYTSERDANIHQDISGIGPENHNIVSISEMPEGDQIRESGDLQETSRAAMEVHVGTNIPKEWISPNLCLPILNLVDVIFQLHGVGWIRRQVFWVAKQVLQLGMGDAFDDWLIEKIQFLRRDSVIASAIRRIEQILWPDGIFITKHPNRRRPTPQSSPKEEGSPKNNRIDHQLSYELQLQNSRSANFVHELIIDKAPVALVGLVGRKEYERCAEDVYNFLQSPICLKHMAFGLLELLLVAAFPELEDAVRRCHEEKDHFGKLEES